MQNIKGAIFDMDGTLLDSMPVWKRLTQNYLKQFDLPSRAAADARADAGRHGRAYHLAL